MSCSKIFSGDLPELTYGIIKYLQNDFLTLHSCILVNRLWCRLTIPLLWENPFSIPTKNYKFIEIYLQNLNDNDFKTNLNIYKINDNLFYLNTLFNYTSFIKDINLLKVITSVGKWFEDSVRTLKPGNRYFLQNLDILSESNFKRLIYISLFKTFIENEVNLNTLNIDIFTIYSYEPYYDDIIVLILQNSNFIHNIKNLNLYFGSSSPNILYHNNSTSEYKLLKSQILQVIYLHQNLKKILLDNNSFPYYQSLFLLKEYNCSNTLNTIILHQVNFNGIINLDKIFEQLNVLESVHITYCYSLNSNFIQQIINLTKPFKLKSLFIEERLQINLLELLLQKSGDYLENFIVFGFDYDLSSRRQLLELITKYCNNIKFLGLYGFVNQITHLVSNLIESINHNLNYLSIHIKEIYQFNYNVDYTSTILQNLGQILPSKLEYLSLSLSIKKSDFKIFLENSQNIFINRLLIMQKGNDDILYYIKEFIMKEKRVKYLAIKNFGNIDLSTLEDEVNEFMLYNIKVLNFCELYLAIRAYEFVKNIDYYL
ncbi:uncharacterized protein OCT59_021095 [Rhizophagus irregularis]|uniref:F-box domain-containing protein n=2 Tax=Rhizophagus irregularis TaxID=588596 RepID=A0A015KLN4_RHIIW|nr:hypothetical protein GLOIN_2v1781395 [Rhizophagus irregularis DAOM 181602=DAOM 197198]EXX68454.1 hypothetical protein RirG_105050 [Rhizophagus irregularis DAOM 197198w]POG65745.1 hypothetical protein GLOIN_2v1781395 [Rhizophagus irregularis DAOM 181602=DAOM 197198]UZO02616.1 hypothetical protein OCT59_021095 [Rhizophagus irregularis]GET60383.1 hypothetical protein GLOIN_2v1781395 [Rhizophagus irregularis DAOM 181602=DAOM 197198]|eukprot:XP_025172611.1 hypothetical protein GLOIN_2v1781395 [Rhizophagus irregularis DAOM 181602=DAOM 197198]